MTPLIVIELAIEEPAPRVLLQCMNDGEQARIMDWVHSQPDLEGLVARALQIAEERPAA